MPIQLVEIRVQVASLTTWKWLSWIGARMPWPEVQRDAVWQALLARGEIVEIVEAETIGQEQRANIIDFAEGEIIPTLTWQAVPK